RKDRFSELRKSKLMPQGDGPFKILEKINGNAYKLQLPPNFGVSPTFNVADLTLYMGEEDELESRTTPLQEGEEDEDITSMHRTEAPPIVIQGPITKARARQLHLLVSSFLSTGVYSFEDGMLPNNCIDYIILRNFGDEHEGLGNQVETAATVTAAATATAATAVAATATVATTTSTTATTAMTATAMMKMPFESKSNWRPNSSQIRSPQPPGAGSTKTDVPTTYGLRFW